MVGRGWVHLLLAGAVRCRAAALVALNDRLRDVRSRSTGHPF
jgi:hypothetical protein